MYVSVIYFSIYHQIFFGNGSLKVIFILIYTLYEIHNEKHFSSLHTCVAQLGTALGIVQERSIKSSAVVGEMKEDLNIFSR